MVAWPTDPVEWIRVLTFVPIVGCSVVGLALTIAKWRQTRWAGPETDTQLNEFLFLVRKRDDARALDLDTDGASCAVRLASAVLRQPTVGGRDSLKERTELLGRQVVREMEYGLGGLALIATLGPLFGLLGTVVGIILIFGQLTASGGTATPTQLAGGIGTALYTTVAGLLVGVFALLSHQLIAARTDRIAAELEATTLEVIELIVERAS